MTRPRVAIVTGAARGIGMAVARRLVASNHHVVLVDRPGSGVSDALRSAALVGGEAIAIEADVTDVAQVSAMVSGTLSHFGQVDILVNNAAITDIHRPWTDIRPADWDNVLATNLKGCFLCYRAVHGHLVDQQWGRVVNIGSSAFLSGGRNMLDYVASKGGVVGFTRALAVEVGQHGITVNTVSPGAIRTEAEVESFPDQAQVAVEVLSRQAVKRRGTPADIAAAVEFLVSEEAGFITGQMLAVNGGEALY